MEIGTIRFVVGEFGRILFHAPKQNTKETSWKSQRGITMSKKNVKVLGNVTCPYCQKTVEISLTTEILRPAEPAEKNIELKAEKQAQTTLTEERERVKP